MIDTIGVFEAIKKLADQRDWGFGDGSNFKAMTHSTKGSINFARFAIFKYVDEYNKLKNYNIDKLFKIKYFKEKFGTIAMLHHNISELTTYITEYLDECMMDIIRKELPEFSGIKINFYSCGIAYNEHFIKPEVEKSKITYTI